jgi:hypothetical protein
MDARSGRAKAGSKASQFERCDLKYRTLKPFFVALAIACVLPWKGVAYAQTQLDARVAWCFAATKSLLSRNRELIEYMEKNRPARPDRPPRNAEESRDIFNANWHDGLLASLQEEFKTVELLYQRYQRFLMLRNAQTGTSEAFVAALFATEANHHDDSERLASCAERFRCLINPSKDIVRSCLRQCGNAVVSIFNRKQECLDPTWLQ